MAINFASAHLLTFSFAYNIFPFSFSHVLILSSSSMPNLRFAHLDTSPFLHLLALSFVHLITFLICSSAHSSLLKALPPLMSCTHVLYHLYSCCIRWFLFKSFRRTHYVLLRLHSVHLPFLISSSVPAFSLTVL